MSDGGSVERRIVSVLFADLVGFTPLAERLDAEDVAAVQDAYFAAVRETVTRHGGALEKFIGDAAMAVFGLDRARDDDAERAVRAGLSLVGAVERLGGQLGLGPGDLQLRVGIESGEVVSAEGGPDQGRVTGDVVNTAARLQTAAPSASVLLGEGAVLATAAAVELGPILPVELKGKAEPVRAALAIGLRTEPAREAAMGALRAPIIGREFELDRLRASLAEASDGRSTAIAIVAAPGTGKSRLLTEFLAMAYAPTWRSRVRADAGASIDAIGTLARDALAGLSSDEVDRRLADGTADARARVLGNTIRELVGAAPASPENADREARFAAWIEALDALAGPGPVIWAIEDIHWASGDVLAFLSAAAQAPTRHGRLIVATARPSVAVHTDASLERLELQPLQAADAGRLVAALVGEALPPDLVLAIEERSDGNPLFIEELLRSWVAVGTLESEDGGWRLTRPPGAVFLPSTVQAIYAGQLDDLPPPIRDVARRASVAGRRFPADALAALGVEAPDIGVEGLLARALVSGPIADAVTGPAFAYRHALLRDAGYSSLGRADRARLHVRLARWLESIAADGRDAIADRIGGHYEAALATAPALAMELDDGLPRSAAAATAAAWLERAADHALALGARDSAVDLLQRCLAHTTPTDGIDAARRMLRLATTTGASGDLGEALRIAERSEAIHRDLFHGAPIGTPDHGAARDGYARASDARAEMEAEQLHFLEARAIAEATLTELDDVHDTAWARLRLRVARAMSLWDDTYDAAAADEVLAIARRHGDRGLELEALWSLAAFSDEAPDVSVVRLGHLADLAAEQGAWQYVAYARRAQGHAVAFAGGDPWPLIDASADVAAGHGLREHLGWADYFRAEIGFMLGEWDIADAAGRRAIGLAETYAYHRVAVRTWFALAPIAAARGDRPTLEHAVDWFTEHAADFPGSPYGRLMHRGVDEILMRAGLVARNEVSLDHLRASFHQDVDSATSAEAVWLVTSSWLDAGRSKDVRSAVEQIRAGFTTLPTSDLIRGVVDVLEARVRLEDGTGDAVALSRSGLAYLRGMRAAWWIRRALRLLEAAGHATPAEVAEAAAIEARLGVVDPML
jgi:class 3 adenylate cyclase